MALVKWVYHHGHKKGLIKTIDDTHGKKRGKYKGIFRKRKPKWYMKEIKGTPEELMGAYRVAEEYLYKIISYAEKDTQIPPEELEEARRVFAFVRQGPRAHHFVVQKDAKLTSADVLYILTTTVPATQIAQRYGLQKDEIVRIRNGSNPVWEWEYHFVKRITAIVRGKLRKAEIDKITIYTLNKINSVNEKEIILYTSSLRKAKTMRESILTKKEYTKLIKDNTLDILYPIEAIEIV